MNIVEVFSESFIKETKNEAYEIANDCIHGFCGKVSDLLEVAVALYVRNPKHFNRIKFRKFCEIYAMDSISNHPQKEYLHEMLSFAEVMKKAVAEVLSDDK